MKKIFWRPLLVLAFSTFCISCVDYLEDNNADGTVEVTAKKSMMYLNASRPSYYEPSLSTRSTSTAEWEDGSVVYISFSNKGKNTKGMASYSSKSGLWEVTFDETLSEISNASCKLYYFDGPSDLNAKGASLLGSTGIYEDLNGIYAYDGKQISMTANLEPKLGRVRFTGSQNDTIVISGINHYGYFDASTLSYRVDTTMTLFSATIKDGDSYYTPYYYGLNADKNRRIIVSDMVDVFSRYYGNPIFEKGESGYMKIPHSTNFGGWMKEDPLTQSILSIQWPDSISQERRFIIENMLSNMVKVNGGRFWMGAQNKSSSQMNYNAYSQIDEYPVFNVTLTPYYINKYEVSEKEWGAVMNGTMNSELPHCYARSKMSSVGQKEILQFIKQLKKITALNIDIPTEAEWEFAASGGNGSTYHYYAGTNVYSYLHDYIYESTSYTVSGKLKPNELGLYDMSGNVSEMCYSIGTYTETSKINPSWNRLNYMYRGGSSSDFYYVYTTSSSTFSDMYACRKYSISERSVFESKGSSYTGFRILLRLIN